MIVDLPAASMRRRDIFARSLANHSPRRVPQVRSWFMNLGLPFELFRSLPFESFRSLHRHASALRWHGTGRKWFACRYFSETAAFSGSRCNRFADATFGVVGAPIPAVFEPNPNCPNVFASSLPEGFNPREP
jgi:hypothetical protein